MYFSVVMSYSVKIKKTLMRVAVTLAILYVLICVLVYFFQEKMIFFPDKLDANHSFEFNAKFIEKNHKMKDGVQINTLLFKADSSKGCVFYVHGNAGSLKRWGKISNLYTALGYDLFIMDFRGYGKSGGEMCSEELFYDDLKCLYEDVVKGYINKKMIVIGYSIGTGPAAMLASVYHPDRLILKAPYYNLTDRVQYQYPFLPGFLLKYKFKTNEFVQNTKCPITIFHGDKDDAIYYESSLKLKAHLKSGDELITIPGFNHNGMNDNEIYIRKLTEILGR